MLILDLGGISFHAVVVFALGKNFLFKFALGHCAIGSKIQKKVCASITPPKKLTDNLIKISKSDFILLNSYSIVVFFLV